MNGRLLDLLLAVSSFGRAILDSLIDERRIGRQRNAVQIDDLFIIDQSDESRVILARQSEEIVAPDGVLGYRRTSQCRKRSFGIWAESGYTR